MKTTLKLAILLAVSGPAFAQEETAVPPQPTPAPSMVEESLKAMRELSQYKSEKVRSEWYTDTIRSKGSQAEAIKHLLETTNDILLLQQAILQNERYLNAQQQGSAPGQQKPQEQLKGPQTSEKSSTAQSQAAAVKDEEPVKVNQTANTVRLVFAGGGKIRRAQIIDASGHEQMVEFNTDTKAGSVVPGLGTVTNITSSEVVFKTDTGFVTRVTYRGQETVTAAPSAASSANNPLLQLLRRN